MKRLLLIPPAAIFGGSVLLWLGQLYALASRGGLFGLFVTAAWLILQVGWPYALYAAFKPAGPRSPWMLDGRTFFIAVPVGAGILSASNEPWLSPVLVLTAISYLVSIWMAARALVAAEGGDDPHGNRKVATALALIYLPLTVWWLRKRVERLWAVLGQP